MMARMMNPATKMKLPEARIRRAAVNTHPCLFGAHLRTSSLINVARYERTAIMEVETHLNFLESTLVGWGYKLSSAVIAPKTKTLL